MCLCFLRRPRQEGRARRPLAPDVDRRFATRRGQLGCVDSVGRPRSAFALQIYFDFSGYSDMAIGLARLLGFRLPENFDSPYSRATSIRLLAPLAHHALDAGSATTSTSRSAAIAGDALRHGCATCVIMMALAGLWHGAAWTFVVWGLVQGAFLGGHAVLSRAGLTPRNVAGEPGDHVPPRRRCVRDLPLAGPADGRRCPRFDGRPGRIDSLDALGRFVPSGFRHTRRRPVVFVNAVPNTWEIEFRHAFATRSSSGSSAPRPSCHRASRAVHLLPVLSVTHLLEAWRRRNGTLGRITASESAAVLTLLVRSLALGPSLPQARAEFLGRRVGRPASGFCCDGLKLSPVGVATTATLGARPRPLLDLALSRNRALMRFQRTGANPTQCLHLPSKRGGRRFEPVTAHTKPAPCVVARNPRPRHT